MRVLNKIFLIACAIVTLTNCGPAKLSCKDYISWIEDKDNGFTTYKDLDDFEFALLYKPIDYVLAKEYLSGSIDKSRIEARRNELGSLQYFTLKIKSKHDKELLRAGIKSEDEYYQRLEYFMSLMQNDLYLIDGEDTLPCVLNHFERNYGLAPYNTFVMAFDQKNETKSVLENKTLVYDDQVLGTGKVMITIEAEDLKNKPEIVWN